MRSINHPFLWLANILGWIQLHPASSALIVFGWIVLLYAIYVIAGW